MCVGRVLALMGLLQLVKSDRRRQVLGEREATIRRL
jgi:hypothetical protein